MDSTISFDHTFGKLLQASKFVSDDAEGMEVRAASLESQNRFDRVSGKSSEASRFFNDEDKRTASKPESQAPRVEFIVQSNEEASAAAAEARKPRFKRREDVAWVVEQAEELGIKHLLYITIFVVLMAWFCILQAKARACFYEDALKRGYRPFERRWNNGSQSRN